MRYAIIDNSTLTAVQRLLGNISIKDKNTIDGDILAFETFLQAILFYDDIFYIDDYNSKYQKQRSDFFKYIYPINFEENDYLKIIEQTQKLTDEFTPNISDKTFHNNNLKEFFNLLKMNMVFCWNLSSSVYQLNFKLLQEHSGVDIKKYSALSSMIFSELLETSNKDKIKNKNPLIYDSKGNIVDSNYTVVDEIGKRQETYISKQTQAFLAGLNWLDFRTTFYIVAANSLGFDLVLHPIRNAYEVNVMKRFSFGKNTQMDAVTDAMNGIANNALNKILSNTDPIVLSHQLPMFSVWIANKCKDVSKFMDVIYDIKGNKEFSKARDKLDMLNNLSKDNKRQNYIRDTNILIDEFTKDMHKLMDTYGVNTSQINLTSSLITAYNVSSIASPLPPIPNINFKINKPNFIKSMYRYNGFGAVYKGILNDLTQIERLGRYHEIITSNVRFQENAYKCDLKTEEKGWLNVKNSWKIPL